MAYYGQPAPGYGQPQQPPVHPMVMTWFQSVDADRSGKISALELQQVSNFEIFLLISSTVVFLRSSEFTVQVVMDERFHDIVE